MCIRDRIDREQIGHMTEIEHPRYFGGHVAQGLSLIHISEPTRLGMISYAVFCLKKKRRPPRSTQSRSSAASDVYKRQDRSRTNRSYDRDRTPAILRRSCCTRPVSYTHLRAHETRHDLVCRLLLEKKTATTEIYTE